MKRRLSFLMLLARGTIWRLLAIMLAMAAVESGLFLAALSRALAAEAAGEGMAGLSQLVSNGRLAWVFAAAYLLTAALLCRAGCAYGSRTDYTIRRLAISEAEIFLWQSGYNCACLLILWAVQLFVALGLCALALARLGPAYQSAQSIYLAFYGNSFLHSLLPLAETLRYAGNAALVFGLGFACAYFSYLQRRGSLSLAAPLLSAAALFLFSAPLNSSGGALVLGCVALFTGVFISWQVLSGVHAYES